MSHIFDPKHFKKLDSPERKKVLPQEDIIALLKPNASLVAADIGCGVGYFSIPFTDHYQTVKAIDISEIMVGELRNRTSQPNIEIMLGDFNTLLDEASVDLFFTCTVIHEVDDLKLFTQQAISKLKSEGQLAYVDFIKKDSTIGPPQSKRIASDDLMVLLSELGLKDIECHNIKNEFYMVTGIK